MFKVIRISQRHRVAGKLSTSTIIDFINHNSITYQTTPQLEPILNQLPANAQISLLKQYPSLINVQFQTLLKQNSLDTFQFILTHHQQLFPELIQIYLFNLLNTNNILPVVTLLHKLSDNDKFTLSNEIWSMLVSKTCETSSHFGAIFIYHNLINNYKYYIEEPTMYVRENNLIPFLINVETIEQIAMIFANTKDASRVEGMFEYFRRFYSFAYNKKVFKSLMFLLIEVYSEINPRLALTKFNQLSYAYDYKLEKSRNYIGKIDSKKTDDMKDKAVAHATIRLKNIMNNDNVYTTLEQADIQPNSSKKPLDIHQELVAKLTNIETFNPMIQRNLYTRDYPKKSTVPILTGSIQISDLPNFHNLMLNLVQQTLNNLNQLLSICQSNHFHISNFVIVALCDVNRFDLIFPLLNQLTPLLPERSEYQQPQIIQETFMYILSTYQLRIQQNSNHKQQLDFLHELYQQYIQLHSNSDVSFLYNFIHTMLLIPIVTKYDLEKYIRTYQMYKPKLYLEKLQYEKFINIKGFEVYNNFVNSL